MREPRMPRGGAARSCRGGSSGDQNATLRERAKITFEGPPGASLAKARPTTCATTTVLRPLLPRLNLFAVLSHSPRRPPRAAPITSRTAVYTLSQISPKITAS